jgi:hypothetical protein
MISTLFLPFIDFYLTVSNIEKSDLSKNDLDLNIDLLIHIANCHLRKIC